MPYKVFKDGDQYCVHKENPDGSKGDRIGCHDTEEKAQAQMRAIYVNEKEMLEPETEEKAKKPPPPPPSRKVTDDDEKPSGGKYSPVQRDIKPDRPKNPPKDENKKRGEDRREEKREPMPGKFPDSKYEEEHQAEQPKKKFADMISDAIDFLGMKIKKPLPPRKRKSFLITKTKGGGYRWLAIYSNNYRDRDNPPEIISSEAHERYVKEVDAGLWPKPILEFWHVKGTRFGAADMVAYEPDTGFAIATGTIDKGHERQAERLKELIDKGEDIRVSHGFPEALIERENRDKSVITRYVTQEISVLPGRAAANALTGFSIDKKEVTMPLPEKKKQFLSEVGEFTDDQIKQLETDFQDKAKEGEKLERKETAEAPAPEPEAEAAPEIAKEEVVEGIVEAVKPLMENDAAQETEIKQLKTRVEELETIVKELKKEDDVKMAEKAAETPKLSIAAMVVKSMESRRVAVAKDDPLKKAGPVMPKEQKSGRTGLFFDEFLN